MNYIDFLFYPDGSVKPRYQPVLSFNPSSDSFILKYSVPGYHSPRQYFSFSSLPSSFPNCFVAEIFRIFSITDSILFRRPRHLLLKPRTSIIRAYFNLPKPAKSYSSDETQIAQYNYDLAIKLGKQHHSFFFFNDFLESYKILHPNLKYTKNVVSRVLALYNSLISL